MRRSSTSWAWSRFEASVLLIIDDRSLFNYEQWWMGNSLSGLSHVNTSTKYQLMVTQTLWGMYLHLSSTCIATQGGAVSPFFSVCIQLFLDYKEQNWLIRFFLLNETSAQTPFKELSMTTSSPYVLEAYFCGCRCSCCYYSCHLKAKSMSLWDCLTQTH